MGPYLSTLRSKLGRQCIMLPGVRAIILDGDGKVLLQRRTDWNCWGLPAGGVELDETAEDALRREIREETSLEVRHAEPMGLHSGPSQRIQYPNGDEIQGFAISFIVRDWTGQPQADGVEGSEVRFWPMESLPEDIAPVHRQTLDDFKRYDGAFLLGGA